jgi:hypothetical protein
MPSVVGTPREPLVTKLFRVVAATRQNGNCKRGPRLDLILEDTSEVCEAITGRMTGPSLAPGHLVHVWGCFVARGGKPLLVISEVRIVSLHDQLSLF